MANIGPIRRSDLIHYLKQAGFEGPRKGGKHEFMLKGALKLVLPNPHRGDISLGLLMRLLRQAGIAKEDWEKL